MNDSRAIPIVCDRCPAVGHILYQVQADGNRLTITTFGAEYAGWQVTWLQLILALQDAARDVQYVKAAE